MRAAFSANYLDRLPNIQVPTLILTPAYDRLIGPEAAGLMLRGIPDAAEVILPNTGHMFRFTHPLTYAGQIRDFLQNRLSVGACAR
jgi:pimeloyl-ACP methyl ester carboxylesterase